VRRAEWWWVKAREVVEGEVPVEPLGRVSAVVGEWSVRAGARIVGRLVCVAVRNCCIDCVCCCFCRVYE